MFQVFIPSLSVLITLRSRNGDTPATPFFTGDKTGQEIIKFRLSRATGAFGHVFSVLKTTPIDLHYALVSSMPDTEIKIIKGSEMIENYSKGIPTGVQS